MDSKLIYDLANKLTDKDVSRIVSLFDSEKIKLYNTLVRLGDNPQLACATVIYNKPIDKESLENYRFAYEN